MTGSLDAQAPRVPALPADDAPVHLLVPLAAGSSGDALARALADALRPRVGRAIIVENRPGATGRIAVDHLQRTRPDGLTLLLAPLALPVMLPIMYPDAEGEPARRLVPVARVARFDYALAVTTDVPAARFADFVDWMRSHPDRARFGTLGAGSVPHLLTLAFAREAKVDIAHAPYNGTGLLNADVVNGTLTASFAATSDLLPLHRAGRLRILATTGSRRTSALAGIPTVAEAGWPSLAATGWIGVFAPAGTPASVVEAWTQALGAVLQDSAMHARLAALDLEPAGSSAQELAAEVAANQKRWAPVLRQAGLAP